jgi:hypothetical protein
VVKREEEYCREKTVLLILLWNVSGIGKPGLVEGSRIGNL